MYVGIGIFYLHLYASNIECMNSVDSYFEKYKQIEIALGYD